MKGKFQAYMYLALAMLMVGSTVVASKIIASGLPPFTATALRFALAFPVFLILMRVSGVAWPRLRRAEWLVLLIQAVAGSVGYTSLLIAGVRLTSAADAGVIIGTLPIVAAAIAIFVLRERPSRFLLMAIALAAAGVLSIVFRPDTGADSAHSLLGNSLVFGAVLCEGLFILLNKRIQTSIPPLAMSTLMTGMGLLAAAILALFEPAWTGSMTVNSLWAVAYYALIPTVLGFLLWYAGAQRVSGSEASLFTALAPVSAVLLAMTFLGEPVNSHQMTGIACVLVAVTGLGWSERKSMKP